MHTKQTSIQLRSLAISLSSRGFGYAVMEGNDRLVAYGKKIFSKDKNLNSLAHIEKMIIRYQPGVLVLQDVKAEGTYRVRRIKTLHRNVVVMAKEHRIKVATILGRELHRVLLGNKHGTKQQMAEVLAQQFPEELAELLPPKRKAWKSEDARMDIFDAIGLVITLDRSV